MALRRMQMFNLADLYCGIVWQWKLQGRIREQCDGNIQLYDIFPLISAAVEYDI